MKHSIPSRRKGCSQIQAVQDFGHTDILSSIGQACRNEAGSSPVAESSTPGATSPRADEEYWTDEDIPFEKNNKKQVENDVEKDVGKDIGKHESDCEGEVISPQDRARLSKEYRSTRQPSIRRQLLRADKQSSNVKKAVKSPEPASNGAEKTMQPPTQLTPSVSSTSQTATVIYQTNENSMFTQDEPVNTSSRSSKLQATVEDEPVLALQPLASEPEETFSGEQATTQQGEAQQNSPAVQVGSPKASQRITFREEPESSRSPWNGEQKVEAHTSRENSASNAHQSSSPASTPFRWSSWGRYGEGTHPKFLPPRVSYIGPRRVRHSGLTTPSSSLPPWLKCINHPPKYFARRF